MRIIPAAAITDLVAELSIKANTKLPPDIVAALDESRKSEPWPLAKQTLDLLCQYTRFSVVLLGFNATESGAFSVPAMFKKPYPTPRGSW